MRWLLKSSLRILVVPFLLLVTANGLAASQHTARTDYHRSETTPQTGTVKQEETQVPLFAFHEALGALEQQAIANQKQIEVDKEAWCSPPVLVNIVLAFIGAAYLVFTGLQWRVLRWAFLADNRPRIGIRHIALVTIPDDILASDSEGNIREDNRIEIRLRLINRGGSNAKIVEGNITLRVDEADGMVAIVGKQKVLPPFDRERGTPSYCDERNAGKDIIVKPAEPYSLRKIMPLGSIHDTAKAYLAVHRERNLDTVALHAFGYFRYRSPGWLRARRTYFTAFCRRYDVTKGGFVVINEPDYEYED